MLKAKHASNEGHNADIDFRLIAEFVQLSLTNYSYKIPCTAKAN